MPSPPTASNASAQAMRSASASYTLEPAAIANVLLHLLISYPLPLPTHRIQRLSPGLALCLQGLACCQHHAPLRLVHLQITQLRM
eukprot:1152872-Pelagomonas_calceolata.AAC.8